MSKLFQNSCSFHCNIRNNYIIIETLGVLIFNVHPNSTAMNMEWSLKSVLSCTGSGDMEQTKKCYVFVDLSILTT